MRARNVPGVAMYMTSLTQLRTLMARSPAFAPMHKHVANPSSRNSSVLPSLTNQGNMVAGATTRVLVGFMLNPFSVLKARYEVDILLSELLIFFTEAVT
jgi:solute carrier family 25, member 38